MLLRPFAVDGNQYHPICVMLLTRSRSAVSTLEPDMGQKSAGASTRLHGEKEKSHEGISLRVARARL